MATAAPTQELDPALFPGPIQHQPEHRLLYCRSCTAVVFLKGLPRHLQHFHRVFAAARQPLLKHCQSLDLITQPKDLQLLPDHSPALQFLPVHTGYSCSLCRFLTCSEDSIRRHINQAHKLYWQACSDNYQLAQLQSWFPSTRAQYWIVQSEATAIPLAIPQRSTSGTSNELHRLEQQEIERLERLKQDHIAQEAALENSQDSSWLRCTQWPAQFAGLSLEIIAATAVLPEKAPQSDRILGPFAGEQFLSPVADEVKLRRLVQLLDRMFDRCDETVAATPHLLRCWLHTTTLEGFWPKPFQLLGRPKSQQKYRAHWKQFICFAFRVWATDSTSGLQHQVYGNVQFSRRQRDVMSFIWAHLDHPDGSFDSQDSLEMDSEVDPEMDPEMDLESDWEIGLEIGSDYDSDDLESDPKSDPESDNHVLERLFQLSCLFWVDGSTTGHMAHLPLVYFSGVLGIHRSTLAYRTAYHYTPYAASLVWIGRQLLLEYALPKEPYSVLNWPAAASYEDQLERLQYIRRKYLCCGSAYPMGQLIDTMASGRAIARKEGRRTNISWSPDKQTLKLDKQLVSLYNFHSMV